MPRLIIYHKDVKAMVVATPNIATAHNKAEVASAAMLKFLSIFSQPNSNSKEQENMHKVTPMINLINKFGT